MGSENHLSFRNQGGPLGLVTQGGRVGHPLGMAVGAHRFVGLFTGGESQGRTQCQGYRDDRVEKIHVGDCVGPANKPLC